jgi:outer membrane protein assembly factor BamB
VGGSARTQSCANCGHANPAGTTRWCGGCGAALGGSGDQASRPDVGGSDLPVGDAHAAAGRGWRGRVVVVAGAGVAVALTAIVVGRGWVEDRSTSEGLGVELPDPDVLPTSEEPGDAEVPAELADADELDVSEEPARVEVPAEGGGAVCVSDPDCIVWSRRVRVPPLPRTLGAGVADGLLVVAERSEVTTANELAVDVVAVDVATGEQVWETTVTTSPWQSRLPLPMRPGVVIADRWVIAADCGQLAGLDLADGEVVWTLPMGCPFIVHDVVAAPSGEPEVVLAVTATQDPFTSDWVVTVVDIPTGTIRWSREVVRAAATTHGVVVLDADGWMLGLDPVTGESRWALTPSLPSPDLRSVAGAVLESDGSDLASTSRLRSTVDGQLLLDDAVQRHGIPTVGRTETQRRAELVTTAEQLVLVVDGQVRWSIPQPQVGCCVSSYLAEDHAAVQLGDGSVLVLDQADGTVMGEHDQLRFQVATDNALVGRFVIAAFEPISDDALTLRVFDAQAHHLVATLPASRVLAALPDGDVLFVVNDEVVRITGP